MGLTLHYQLSLKDGSAAEARSLIESLRRHAQSVPFASVSEIIELEGGECGFDQNKRGDPHARLKVQTTRFLTGTEDDVISVPGESHPIHTIAFTVDPGEGSEPANLGLCQ